MRAPVNDVQGDSDEIFRWIHGTEGQRWGRFVMPLVGFVAKFWKGRGSGYRWTQLCGECRELLKCGLATGWKRQLGLADADEAMQKRMLLRLVTKVQCGDLDHTAVDPRGRLATGAEMRMRDLNPFGSDDPP